MPLTIAALNSGSNGNCYYVGNNRTAILIDAGISARETLRRMQRLGLAAETIQAIFITHEHHDHVTGLPALARKWQCPVYLTQGTLKELPVPLSENQYQIITPGTVIPIEHLKVTPFAKSHDAAAPISIVVSDSHTHVGIFTDIGYCCKNVIHYFQQCDAIILESNYCEELLENGNYPESLKKRIRGRKGHLSNNQALELFLRHRSRDLSHLVLGHLSQQNNTQEKVRQLFEPHAGRTTVMVASRYKETPLLSIPGSAHVKTLHPPIPVKAAESQLKLF